MQTVLHTMRAMDEPTVPEWDTPDRLRKALQHAGIESNEMAEYLEVTRQTISNWINGRTRPPTAVLRLWAIRCNVPYEWITHGDRAPVRTSAGSSDYGPPAITDPDIPSGVFIYTDLDRAELIQDFRTQLGGLHFDNGQVTS